MASSSTAATVPWFNRFDYRCRNDGSHFTKLHEYFRLVTETSERVQQLVFSDDLSNRRLRPAQALAQDCKTAGDSASLQSKAILSNNKVSRSALTAIRISIPPPASKLTSKPGAVVVIDVGGRRCIEGTVEVQITI